MSRPLLLCPRCGQPFAPGTRYCLRCGEPVDAQLITQLQSLYTTLADLDARISQGKGAETITALRDEYREQYLSLRKGAPAAAATSTSASSVAGAAAPTTVPLSPLGAASAPLSGIPAQPAEPAQPIQPIQPMPTPVAASQGPQPPVAAPQPAPGPAFSWQAFIAEQAIAIMAYLGGFLLLVATLTFEVGGWQVLPNIVKLGVVVIVYLAFGVLGFALRRSRSLHTVGQAYLGVFALLTPLVALALYRFELQSQGFSASGMLCLSAFYAAIIYLALAWQTRFSTYAYLGWVALLVGALALNSWLNQPIEWDVFSFGIVALALLVPYYVRWLVGAYRDPRRGWLTGLETLITPALQIGAILSILTAALTLLLGVTIAAESGIVLIVTPPSKAAFALAALTLVPLAVGWSQAIRASGRPTAPETLDLLDWLAFAFGAQSVLGVAAWVGADRQTMAYVFAALAFIETLAALFLRRRWAARVSLRYPVEVLALALASLGALIVIGDPSPNLPLIVALTAGVVVGALLMVNESPLGWGIVAGAFLLFDCHAALTALVPAARLDNAADRLPDALLAAPTWHTLLIVVLWSGALAINHVAPRPIKPVGPRLAPHPYGQPPVWPGDPGYTPTMPPLAQMAPSTQLLAQTESSPQPVAPRAPATPLTPRRRIRSYLAAFYLTILADAIYVGVFLLGGRNGHYVTSLLLLYTLVALVAMRVEREPMVGGFIGGAFAFFAPIAFVGATHSGIAFSLMLLGVGGSALLLRRTLGRAYCLTPYLLTLWFALVTLPAFAFSSSTADWIVLGVPFASWTLLALAALAVVAALWENAPGLMAIPALLVLIAQALTHDVIAAPVLVFALAGTGMALRRWRGPGWGAAWYVAAIFASIFAHYTLYQLGGDAPGRQVMLLALYMVVVYLVAMVERLPWLSLAALPFAQVLLAVIPAPHDFSATLTVFGGALLLALVLRLRIGRRWAIALYGVAFLATVFAVVRITPADGAHQEALLLVFAAIAYAVAYIERTPWAGFAPAFYAAWAALVQPDPHALLLLAIALAVVGYVVGRVAGSRWSWPAYAAAGVVAVATALQSQPHPQFETLALLTLAVVAYLIAAAESRAEAIPLAFVLGGLGIASGANAFSWPNWLTVLAFVALAWLYALGGQVWRRLPWLPSRGAQPQTSTAPNQSGQSNGRSVIDVIGENPRTLGVAIHFWSGLIVGVGAVLGAMLSPYSFAQYDPQTLSVALGLLAFGGLLGYVSRETQQRWLWYLAGEAAALAITWGARWAGATNTQAFILAPGSYQLLIGAILPTDTRVPRNVLLGQIASLAGVALLLLPTLMQSFSDDPTWLYALWLALEALVITGLGIGARKRSLVVAGSCFVGLSAIRGGVIAVSSGLPLPLVIGALALLLMGGATWLSLRARRLAPPNDPATPAPAPQTDLLG